jgi:hypothetical protein
MREHCAGKATSMKSLLRRRGTTVGITVLIAAVALFALRTAFLRSPATRRCILSWIESTAPVCRCT